MLKDFNTFVNEKKVNENILGKIGSWIKGKWMTGEISKLAEEYKVELPKVIRERMIKEFEAIYAKKSGAESEAKLAEQEVETLKEQEQNIRQIFYNKIEEILKDKGMLIKTPDLKIRANSLKLEAQKHVLEETKKIIKELKGEEKFKDISEEMDDKFKKIAELEKKINTQISNNKKAAEGYNKGEIYNYKTSEEKDNIVIIIGVDDRNIPTFLTIESKEEMDSRNESLGEDKIKEITKEKDDDGITEKDRNGFTPNQISDIGDKITDEKILEYYADLIGMFIDVEPEKEEKDDTSQV